jgi:hypothetical protein
MRKLLLLLALASGSVSYSQPTNDNCANATTLTVNGSILCGQTTNNATTQTGEHCAASGGGVTPRTVWYRFTATSTSMVINVLRTNSINCFGYLSVYGPNPTCMPGAGSAILSCVLMNGDPGYYPLLTGLTVGATYFVNYNGSDCGGGNDRFHNFCIGVYTPASNNTAPNASQINQCGFVYNGTTLGGYSATGGGTRRDDFDGDGSNDVPWVGNNDSWFYFCAGAAGTYNIQFNVGTCIFSGANSGGQMSILKGSPSTGFTNIGNSTNPTASGSSWTSSNFSLGAGECVYLVVDGFAGDGCNYSYTLTNVSGGCVLLNNITNLSNKVYKDKVELYWDNLDGIIKNYTIERSLDGYVFSEIANLASESIKVDYIDNFIPNVSVIYYRLSTDDSGIKQFSSITVANLKDNKKVCSIKIFDVYGRQYTEDNLPKGVVIYVTEFEDGHVETSKEYNVEK